MDILSGFNSDIFPGHRIVRVKSWDEWVRLQVPRDCELIGIDESNEKNYLYMKWNDANNKTVDARYRYEDDPVQEFDPEKYVTVEQFNKLMEEVNNGFDSLRQSITASHTATGGSGNTKSFNGNK